MAKFRFAQEKQITTWVRDFYEVEADNLDEAIAIVEEADCSLDELEFDGNRVEWVERDTDNMIDWAYEDNGRPTRYNISSCDTGDEIVSR